MEMGAWGATTQPRAATSCSRCLSGRFLGLGADRKSVGRRQMRQTVSSFDPDGVVIR